MKFDKKEMARDLMGLGSIPFLILVLVRVGMAGNFLEMFHIVAAVALFHIISIKIQKISAHTVRIVILVIFTSVFYDDHYYTAFAALTGVYAIYGFIRYLERERIILSLFVGLGCSIVSYLISLPLGIPNI
jgi:hypothetical protein